MKSLLLLLIALPTVAFADRDATRYPRDSAYYSTDYLGSFKGVFKEVFAMHTQVRVDPSFTEGQKGILKEALEIFMGRALRPETLACAYKSATKDLPESQRKVEISLAAALSPFAVGEARYPAFVFISRFWSDPTAVGIGYQNFFNDPDNRIPGFAIRSYLHIALNSDFLGYDSRYLLAKDAEYWAGVIGHEFLHNLGYDHPNGYKGSFIEEYGNCIATNGITAEAPAGVVHDRKVEKGN